MEAEQDTRYRKFKGNRGGRGGRVRNVGEIEGFGHQPDQEMTDKGMGMLLLAPKESVDYIGKHEGYQGKPRELWHPYDRKSGTGRGKELPKGGHGRGNWGNLRDELVLGDQTLSPSIPAAETTEITEIEQTELPESKKSEVKEVAEPEVISKEDKESESRLTLSEYLASKKKSNLKKDMRSHEGTKFDIKSNFQDAEIMHSKTEQLTSSLKN